MKPIHNILVFPFFLILMETVSCKEMQPVATLTLTPFASGLVTPVCITHAGDSRLFVVNQHGMIMVVNSNGSVNPQPFLDISVRVTYGGERGLLGLAFDPDYKTNGYFYVNYIGLNDSTHISRFSVTAANPDIADPGSEFNLFTIFQPYVNHNGGDLIFGPDGYLYIGLGDGGSGGDPGNRAQNLSELLGKILRIDIHQGSPYSIPVTNPFYNSTTARNEIWALGFRNPWRFSFDRLTGDLWIADVGQNLYEEIDFQPASSTGGENYGWRCYEGNAEYNTVGCNSSSSYIFPVYAYPHGPECSVIGGYVYRTSPSSLFYGNYFFSDYCSDRIWTLHNVSGTWSVTELGQFTGNNFSTFGEDVTGNLYIAGLTSGTIYRISDSPTALNQPQSSSKVTVTYLPGTGKVIIDANKNTGAEIQFTVFNTIGIPCLTSSSGQCPFTTDISFLPKGIYFLNILSDGQHIIRKVLKN